MMEANARQRRSIMFFSGTEDCCVVRDPAANESWSGPKNNPSQPFLCRSYCAQGPKFKIKLELHNQGERTLTNLPVDFSYDRNIYRMSRGQFIVSALLPVGGQDTTTFERARRIPSLLSHEEHTRLIGQQTTHSFSTIRLTADWFDRTEGRSNAPVPSSN